MDESVEDNEKKDDNNNDDQITDIDFVYNDADEYSVEIAELYSYSEGPEFKLNKDCFEDEFKRFVSSKWFETSSLVRHTHILRLLDRLESGNRSIRQKAARGLLYLLQGNFGDCELEEDQITWARRNVYLCIEAGLLPSIIQLLLLEIGYDQWTTPTTSTETNEGEAATEPADTTPSVKKTVQSLADSMDLRVILSILYIMIETVRDGMINEHPQSVFTTNSGSSSTRRGADTVVSPPSDSLAKLREQFCEELASPIGNDDDTTLTVILFGMVHRFCSGLAPHFPMKKVLLLLWKVLLVTLGPVTTLFSRKNAARARYNLPPLFEDSNQVIRRVRANSPPGSSTDQILSRAPRNNTRHTIFGQGNQAPRQGSLAGGRIDSQLQPQHSSGPSINTSSNFPFSTSQPRGRQTEAPPDVPSYEASGFATPRPGSPVGSRTIAEPGVSSNLGTDTPMPGAEPVSGLDPDISRPPMLQGLNNFFSHSKTLPWKPKVRKKDLETFLTNARLKFVGFHVPNDTTSLTGLPEPIHEAVKVMREHLYVSLGEVQIQRENDIARNPISMGREEIPDTPVERLYRAMYPLLPQYMIALLKVLLAAAPTSRAKTEPTNILAEVLPGEIQTDVGQKLILNIDISRHRELIVKAISAILLLLLKHMKLNHVYQFEYVSQYLVIANCIPLILKFFNQNTCHYVQAKNTCPVLDFPSRLIGKAPELALESLLSDWSSYCWRNLFACINLLRVLNMLTKWKHSRTMLLVVFKSAPILKRTLRVRHAMMQLYVLKLLKLQSRYFGRQWRKNNMSIMSAIYQKVRHRLTDDWAYGNDVDALPWQFQVEEYTLRTNVDQFNQRRYSDSWIDPLFQPVDNSLMSVLSQPMQLSDEFKRNYEKWLEEEVFSVPINWSQVLAMIN